ncbi:hypothetical protein ACFWBM_00385 [Streptomyces sp. NPDC059980]|uniref:hypothetical protein n=1 Tax=Streptomyces sp. NPDC059980 TaxID=3347022 RepID=UPI0036A2AF47
MEVSRAQNRVERSLSFKASRGEDATVHEMPKKKAAANKTAKKAPAKKTAANRHSA